MKNGLKYIIEPRFYPFSSDNLFTSRLFFAPSFDLRYVVINRNEWMIINNSYQQKMEFDVTRLAYGVNAKFGITTSIKKRLPIEIVVGLGARYVTLKNNIPKNINYFQSGNNSIFQGPGIEGVSWQPSVYVGMLLYLFQTKKK